MGATINNESITTKPLHQKQQNHRLRTDNSQSHQGRGAKIHLPVPHFARDSAVILRQS